MKRTTFLIVLGLILIGYAHQESFSKSPQISTKPTTLGYLQFKTPYAKAAWEEGKLLAIKRVLEHRHSKTRKPYPCWNALKPFRNKDLPVSLKLTSPQDGRTGNLLALAGLPSEKFDAMGRDGQLTLAKPDLKAGFTTWRIDQTFKKLQQTRFNNPVIGLIDISGSMSGKKKLNTLRGLKDSNIQFESLYSFSGRGSLREISLKDLEFVKPQGDTALYDNLIALIAKNPNEEIYVLTDGKDNKSKTSFKKFLEQIGIAKNPIDVVLTGGSVDEDFSEVAQKTNGRVLHDIREQGEILQPVLEVSLE